MGTRSRNKTTNNLVIKLLLLLLLVIDRCVVVGKCCWWLGEHKKRTNTITTLTCQRNLIANTIHYYYYYHLLWGVVLWRKHKKWKVQSRQASLAIIRCVIKGLQHQAHCHKRDRGTEILKKKLERERESERCLIATLHHPSWSIGALDVGWWHDTTHRRLVMCVRACLVQGTCLWSMVIYGHFMMAQTP